MPKKSKPKYKYAKYLIRCELPRCSMCSQLLIADCDRSKPSKLTRFKGRMETKTKPQFIWMFPTADEQNDLCGYCESELNPVKIGKDS
ncbi:hypothetical protein KAW50_06525 [candidate division WOR-3 bacterium]|nr:hypothetical protein [candidate division WOR-3 bacterium]